MNLDKFYCSFEIGEEPEKIKKILLFRFNVFNISFSPGSQEIIGSPFSFLLFDAKGTFEHIEVIACLGIRELEFCFNFF
jgi:hypothetical protein